MTSTPASIDSFPTERTCPFSPPEVFKELRQDETLPTVNAFDGSTPWLITRYADAKAVLASPNFSARMTRPGYPLMSNADAAQRDSDNPALLRTDDPEHREKRRRLTREFTVKRIHALRPEIQRIIDESIDEMLASGSPADLVSGVALPIPSRVICLILGVPYEHHAFFQQKSTEALTGSSGQDTVEAALAELGAFLDELIDTKLAEPREDLLSRLAEEYLRPGTIDRRELITIGMTLLVAGFETTGNMIGLGTALLLSHPDQLAKFLDGDEAFQANAVEELLRYLSIAQHPRQFACVEDTEIGGNLVRAGEGVLISLPSSNRDEAAFDDADTFDITRSARHHLAFSYGTHQCLGQSLARLELLLYFRTVFTRVPGIRLTEAPEDFDLKKNMRAHGFNSLEVAW